MTTSSVSGVGTISSLGVGSGLDASSIIEQLMAVEEKPLDNLKTQASTLNTQLSTYGKLQSYTSALQDSASALSSLTLWKQTTATSSSSSAVSATTSSTTAATAGNYQVSVQSLASVQSAVGGTFSSSSATLAEGDLSIQLGSWSGSSFTAKSSSSAVNVHVTAGTTLSDLRDQINSAGAGVVASIITDASGARLSITSKSTGTDNGFSITGSGGAASLSYDGSSGGMTLTQSAANAQATINGIAISSASNTLDNVVDGLTLKLQTVTTTPVTVTVATDTDAIKKAINSLVSSYNSLASYITTQTKYDADTKTAGALQGDRATLNLQSQLRSVLNQSSTASSNWSVLSDIGITTASDGTLTVNSTKLDSALANPSELQKLFAADGSDSASSGFAQRFKTLTTQLLGTDGPFEARTQSIQARLTRNSTDQDNMQKRLDQTEARLKAQYSALDTAMAKLTSLSSYMTQQISSLNNSSS